MSSRPSRGAARLAAILDALPDGLLLVNCNGTVVNANTIALEMFETPGTALVGRGLLDLLPEFDSKLIPGSMRRTRGCGRAGPYEAHAHDRAAYRRQRVPRRGDERQPGGRAGGVQGRPGLVRGQLHGRRAADARRARPLRHRRHRGRAGPLAAPDRDDPAGRGRGCRRYGHGRPGRPGQPRRRADPRLPGQRSRRPGAAPADPALPRGGRALPVRGVPTRRHAEVGAQTSGARPGSVVEERGTGAGRPDDRARPRRRPARRRRDDVHRPPPLRRPGQAAQVRGRRADREPHRRGHRAHRTACRRARRPQGGARRGAGRPHRALRLRAGGADRAADGPHRPAHPAHRRARRVAARPPGGTARRTLRARRRPGSTSCGPRRTRSCTTWPRATRV